MHSVMERENWSSNLLDSDLTCMTVAINILTCFFMLSPTLASTPHAAPYETFKLGKPSRAFEELWGAWDEEKLAKASPAPYSSRPVSD